MRRRVPGQTRAFANQEYVLALLHDRAGKQYGILDPARPSDDAGGVEDRTAPPRY
jgi:hypothetical protein